MALGGRAPEPAILNDPMENAIDWILSDFIGATFVAEVLIIALGPIIGATKTSRK